MDKEGSSTPGAGQTSNTVSLGEAIARAIGDRSRRALARELGISASSIITRWTQNAHPPSIENVRKLEEALGLRRGWVYIAAGLVEPAIDVPSAIDHDPELDDPGRAVLHSAYNAAVEHCRIARQMASARDHGDHRSQ